MKHSAGDYLILDEKTGESGAGGPGRRGKALLEARRPDDPEGLAAVPDAGAHDLGVPLLALYAHV